MALQTYIDDSRKRGIFVLAGHIDTDKNWANLSVEWQDLLPYATLNKHDRREFKMVDMLQNPERMDRIQPFYRLIEKYTEMSFATYVHDDDITRALRRIHIPSLGLRLPWLDWYDKSYVVAWAILMDNFHSKRSDFAAFLPNCPVDFILDEQSEKRIILEGWDTYIEKKAHYGPYGAAPSFRDSERTMPLQAADLWAGWVRRCIDRCELWNIDYRDFGAWRGSAHPIFSKFAFEDDLFRSFSGFVRKWFGEQVVDEPVD